MRKLTLALVIIAVAVLLPTLAPGWGDVGHTTINRVAAEKIPASMPQFLKAASGHIGWLGPEPDRWRSNLEKPLNDAQAPDHFIDLEFVDWLNPLPPDLGDIMAGFDHVLVPELNMGQLLKVIRAKYLVPATGLNKIKGQPFKVSEVEAAVEALLKGDN